MGEESHQAAFLPGEADILERMLSGWPISAEEAAPFIVSLAQKGFVLESEGRRALLREARDDAFPYQVMLFKGTEGFPSRILSFLDIPSTNAYLKEHAAELPSGTFVFTEEQTQGRGKWDRAWFMLRGKSLIFSFLLKTPLREKEHAGLLTMAAAASIAKAARRSAGVPCRVKWPNDVISGGRKLCGILTESAEAEHGVSHVIIGAGINFHYAEDDFPLPIRLKATSLLMESDRPSGRLDFFRVFLEEFSGLFAEFQSGRFAAVMDKWQDMCGPEKEQYPE
jgi:BirA family biotin operon repressor/biotin-[acetyl-CoA-carboxylase] ligase